MKPIRTVAAWLTIASVLAPSFAWAQPKQPDVRAELPEPAKKAWDDAKVLVRANKCSAAIPEFLHAYDLSKNPRVLFNAGACERVLNRYTRAVMYWEQELNEGDKKLTADEKAEVKSAIQAVSPFITTVDITANEQGAALFVDDLEVGKTPFTKPLPIDKGEHVLVLRKEGFNEQTFRKSMVGPEKLAFELMPITKRSKVTVNVTGAPSSTVFMDGKDVGPAPFKGEVTAESHTFWARAPGYQEARQTVDVKFGEPMSLVLALALERHQGMLRVEVTPKDAVVSIDGTVLDASPWEGTVVSRTGHTVVAKRAGYETQRQEVVVGDDQRRVITLSLPEEKVNRSFIWWAAGTLAVLGGTAVVGYFVLKPTESSPYVGTFQPGITTGHFK